jgi:PAS domain-containing protein
MERWVEVALDVLVGPGPARRAADQHAARERELRLVADNSQDLVPRVGRDGIIEYASPASRDLVGRSPSEVTGLPLLSLVHADDHVGVGPLVHAPATRV